MVRMNALLKARKIALPGIILAFSLLYPAVRQDAQTRRPPRGVTSLTDVIYSTQFSPDSKTLAIARGAGGSGRVELWDVETGTLKRAIKGFDGAVWSVSFSPDGKTLVTGGSGFRTNKLQDELGRKNGKRFAELKWWDVETGELKQQMEVPGEERLSVMASHSPNGNLLATVEYSYQGMMASPAFDSLSGNRNGPLSPTTFGNYVGGYNADLKLRDAKTGEVKLKLKSGMISYQSLFNRGYTGYTMPDDALMFVMRFRTVPLTFSPDGQIVAAWNQSEVRLWNTSSGEEVGKLKGFKGRLSAIAFSPDGLLLAAGINQFTVKKSQPIFKSQVLLYEVEAGRLLQPLTVTTSSISALAFSRNGSQLLIGGSRREGDQNAGTVELVSLRSGSLGTPYADETGFVQTLVLSPNAKSLALQTDASTLKLLDTISWDVQHTFDGANDTSSADAIVRRHILSLKSVAAIAFSADGKTLSGGIDQGGVRLWDVRTGEVKKQLAEGEDSGSIMAISSNGTIVGEVGADETLRLWNTSLGEKKTVLMSGSSVSTLALSPDGATLAVGYPSRIVLVDTVTGEAVQALAGQQSQPTKINCLVFSADGRTLASGEDGRVEVWDLATGQIRKTIAADGSVTALRFAPDGRTLASGSQDGSVSLWDLQTGSLSLELRKHTAAVNAIAFSTAGDLMASGGDDRTVIIWETATGKARRTLKGHDLAVTSLAFSPNASLLACGSGNASVVLWDVQTGKLNRVLR